MNEIAVTIILSVSATAVAAVWGFVLGIYHRLKYLEMQVNQMRGEDDAKIH